jgi:antitoxin component of RelBE/YafQ-DinJ toxin-antitoxin module
MGKQIRISFRTTQEFKDRAQAAAKKVGLDETVIEAEAIKAVIAHIERYGEITLPVRLEEPAKKKTEPERVVSRIGSSGLSHGRQSSSPPTATGLNEPEGEYPSRKGKRR